MSTDIAKGLPLKPYLLGDLNPEEQQSLEQRLMTDSAAFEELGYVEDELIDDYLEGALSGREKEQFEIFFLAAPERQKKLSFAKNLKRYISVHRPKEGRLSVWRNSLMALWHIPNPILRWILPVSLLLIIAISAWSVSKISKYRNALEGAEARESQARLAAQKQHSELTLELQREQARSRLLEQEAANLRGGQKRSPSSLLAGQFPATLITIALTPGRQRDLGGGQKTAVPLGTDFVRLDLEIEPRDYLQYQTTLQRADDAGTIMTQISPRTRSGVQDSFLHLIVPAGELRRGDYILKLRGMTAVGAFEDMDTYYFRIIPK